ncbi:hypothetical protein J6590_002652 [Homalodisca vitripennis]|nr:hypothetical protein J6590_002652 [Homalodisca vitripennis]
MELLSSAGTYNLHIRPLTAPRPNRRPRRVKYSANTCNFTRNPRPITCSVVPIRVQKKQISPPSSVAGDSALPVDRPRHRLFGERAARPSRVSGQNIASIIVPSTSGIPQHLGIMLAYLYLVTSVLTGVVMWIPTVGVQLWSTASTTNT